MDPNVARYGAENWWCCLFFSVGFTQKLGSPKGFSPNIVRNSMGAERQLLRSLRTMAPVAPGARVALQSSARLRRTPVKSSDQISLLNLLCVSIIGICLCAVCVSWHKLQQVASILCPNYIGSWLDNMTHGSKLPILLILYYFGPGCRTSIWDYAAAAKGRGPDAAISSGSLHAEACHRQGYQRHLQPCPWDFSVVLCPDLICIYRIIPEEIAVYIYIYHLYYI